MPRRFVTQQDIDALVEAGQDVLEVDDRVTVTDLARERARERGVRLVHGEVGTGPTDTPLREQVRRRVVAEIDGEPPGLDAAIDRALRHASTTPPPH